MLSLHTNNAALSAQSSISRTQSNLSTSMTRLSTGFRINSAMDDAAGLQIATRLKAQSSGMAVAMRNTQNATSMMQTAEGALGEASNILVRMKDLATQAADASSNTSDKTAMQSEYDALASKLTNIIGNTSFGGAKLLNKKADATVDLVPAQAAKLAAQNDLSDAQFARGTSSTPDADPINNPPTGGTGALAAKELKQWEYDDAMANGTPTDVQTAFDALLIATKDLDDADAAITTAQAKFDTASSYESVVQDSVTNGTAGKFSATLNFQIGSSSSETMELDLSSQVNTMQGALGGISARYNPYGAASSAIGTELTTPGAANTAIDGLQSAIDALGSVRSSLGAAANRLDHANTNLSNISANTQAAAGRIMDVDFATESANMTSKQMLMQAGTAMLKQSSQMSSMVMSLLQ